MIKRSASSNRWLKNHFNDKYVKQAQYKGIRSRAWFKLDEIQKNNKLFSSGKTIIDLGAAPGGWSQYISKNIKYHGRIIACDILKIKPIKKVSILQGDITNYDIQSNLFKIIGKEKAHTVLSDMSPNISGLSSIDIPKSINLGFTVLDICSNILIKGGNLLVKIFQGEGFKNYFNTVNLIFSNVKICKPSSSNTYSNEVYILAKGYQL